MSIKVLKPGLQTSIQDLGRYGYQKYGVIVNGGMDTYSLRLANLLVGNEEGEGVLEMTFTGPSLEFQSDVLLSITGGDLSPTINGKPVPMWRPIYVKKGNTLEFGGYRLGSRSYLAMAGGYNVAKVMESRSTYLRAGIGGYQGRALQQGDTLEIGEPQTLSFRMIELLKKKVTAEGFMSTTWYADSSFLPISQSSKIRITKGRQFDLFSTESKSRLLTSSFQIATQSDRMGYRLSGVKLELEETLEMISEAVALGTIQVPPDGNPIILLADRQTVGGYPKIGQVAIVDIPLLAQMRPGGKIQFQEISLETAENLYIEREKRIGQVKNAIQLKFA